MAGRPRRRSGAEILADSMTEHEFSTWVIELAQRLGWLVVHFTTVRLPNGRYVTPFVGNAGFPDLVLAKAGRVLFIELKTTRGVVAPEQKRWHEELGANVHVLRPRDKNRVIDLLSRKAAA